MFGFCVFSQDYEAALCVAEDAAKGPTLRWCAAVAQRLHCTVSCGFPRREQQSTDDNEIGGKAKVKLYNSVMVVSPEVRALLA